MFNFEQALEIAIKISEAMDASRLPKNIFNVQGYSSRKVRIFLNELLGNLGGATYLEIGVHKGSTFISALYGNVVDGYAIDNWSEFATAGTREEFLRNVDTYAPQGTVKGIFEEDCFEFDLDKIESQVDVYFYDGNHSYESQFKAFTYYSPILSDTFIAVVDDYNWEQVRKGTEDAFEYLGYEIKFAWKPLTNKEGDPDSYWNGLGVFLLEKKNEG